MFLKLCSEICFVLKKKIIIIIRERKMCFDKKEIALYFCKAVTL